MNVYHLTIQATKEKYLKFKHRLNKNIASGAFDKLPRKKKSKLVSRLDKLRNRLEGLSVIKKGAVVAGSAALLPSIGLAQDPAMRFEKSDFDINQFGTNQQIEIVNIDSDSDLEILLSTTSRGFVQQNYDSYFDYTNQSALFSMDEEFYIGDIDGDSDVDIVFKKGSYFYLAFNDGDGNFELTDQSYYYSSSSTPGAIAMYCCSNDVDLVDFDGDGDLDLVMAYGTGSLIHFDNDGNGYFSTSSSLSVSGYSGITDFEFVDLDGDEDLDLIHNERNGSMDSEVHVKENTTDAPGNPTFGGEDIPIINLNYFDADGITVFDMDGDGDQDIFVPDNGGISFYSHRILENEDSEGSSFSFANISLSGITAETINDVAVGDLNGDGNDDLAIAFSSATKVGVLDGSSFTATGKSLGGEIGDGTRWHGTVAIGDLDGDGLNDIVGGETSTNDPYIYFDRSAPYISDFDGSIIIDENAPAAQLGTFSFSDFHSDPITASLSGADAGLFTLNSSTGELSANQSFDWESSGSELDLSIDFGDGIKSRTEKVNVRINNLPEKGQGLLREDGVRLDLDENKYLDNFIPVDFDVDGDQDIFYGEYYLLVNGEISFEDGYINDFSSGGTEVVFMDVDDDGDLDLFGKDGGNLYGIENVSKARSYDGWNSFDSYSIGYQAFGLISGDFDNDGLEEIGLITYSGLNYTFKRIEIDADNSGFSEDQAIGLQLSGGGGYMDNAGKLVDIAIADFDGDGNDDLLIIAEADGGDPGTDVIFPGTPSSGFSTSISTLSGAADNGFNRVEVGDFNSDDDPDIAFMRSNGSSVEIDIMLNNGSGDFTVGQTLNLGGDSDTESFDLKLGDMDGDGHLDIVASSTDENEDYSLKMWSNDGDGSFSLTQTLSDISGYEFELMDIDGDDDLDVVVRESTYMDYGHLNVHLNTNVIATDIALTPSSFDEHLAEDTQVSTITVTDQNLNDTHVITLAEGDGSNDAHNNFFAINGNNLILTRDVSAEDFPTLNILLAADDGENIYEQAITLTVNQVNTAPTAIAGPPENFDEGTPAGTSIGTLSATDDGLETVTFALANGDGSNDADNDSFVINGDQLIIKEVASFETKPSYNIYISASDIDGSVAQAFTIDVNNINQAPTAIGLSSDNFDEGTAGGTSVATLSATDADAGDTFTFSLETGDGSNDADNDKFAIEGDQLIVLESLVSEAQSSLNINLMVEDAFGDSHTEAFTLTVNDVNSAPTAITLSASSLNEGDLGATVATISAEDSDSGDTHTFSLVAGNGTNDADNDKFAISNNKLILVDNVEFDDQTQVRIRLRAEDAFGESVSQAFTLSVNEVLGLDEVANVLGIYPNPGVNQININFEDEALGDLQLKVSDLNGRVIYETQQEKRSSQWIGEIDMSSAEIGVYIVEVMINDQVYVQRWVKN